MFILYDFGLAATRKFAIIRSVDPRKGIRKAPIGGVEMDYEKAKKERLNA